MKKILSPRYNRYLSRKLLLNLGKCTHIGARDCTRTKLLKLCHYVPYTKIIESSRDITVNNKRYMINKVPLK